MINMKIKYSRTAIDKERTAPHRSIAEESRTHNGLK